MEKELLGEEDTNMSEPGKFMLPDDRDALLAEVDSLKKQIYRQQMELDILNKAVEIIKRPGHRSPEADEQGKSQPDRCPGGRGIR